MARSVGVDIMLVSGATLITGADTPFVTDASLDPGLDLVLFCDWC